MSRKSVHFHRSGPAKGATVEKKNLFKEDREARQSIGLGAPKIPGRGAPPFQWTEEIEERLFELLASGKSVNAILAKGREDGLPGPDTFYKRVALDKDFAEKYARCAEIRQQVIFEEILRIADTPEIGKVETNKEWGIETKTADMIEHRRLQVDVRKWMLGKMAPKKFGDKLELAGDKESPLTVVVKQYAPPASDA